MVATPAAVRDGEIAIRECFAAKPCKRFTESWLSYRDIYLGLFSRLALFW
jgi:hypothetical protein